MQGCNADGGAGGKPSGDAVAKLTASLAGVSAASPMTTTGNAPKRSVSRPPRVLPATKATPNTAGATLIMPPW